MVNEVNDIKEYTESKLNKGETAELYTKVENIKVRKGVIGEEIVTRTGSEGDYVETKNVVKTSEDVIATGTNGEQWIIDGKKFTERYIEDQKNPGTFKPNAGPQKFMEVHEDISFKAPWGENMTIASGGYLNITKLDEIYGIQKDEFEKTYKLCDENGNVKDAEKIKELKSVPLILPSSLTSVGEYVHKEVNRVTISDPITKDTKLNKKSYNITETDRHFTYHNKEDYGRDAWRKSNSGSDKLFIIKEKANPDRVMAISIASTEHGNFIGVRFEDENSGKQLEYSENIHKRIDLKNLNQLRNSIKNPTIAATLDKFVVDKESYQQYKENLAKISKARTIINLKNRIKEPFENIKNKIETKKQEKLKKNDKKQKEALEVAKIKDIKGTFLDR